MQNATSTQALTHLPIAHVADTAACWDDLTPESTAEGVQDTTCTHCLQSARVVGSTDLVAHCDTVNGLAERYAIDRNVVLKTITTRSLSDRTRAEGNDIRLILNDQENLLFRQALRDQIRESRKA